MAGFDLSGFENTLKGFGSGLATSVGNLAGAGGSSSSTSPSVAGQQNIAEPTLEQEQQAAALVSGAAPAPVSTPTPVTNTPQPTPQTQTQQQTPAGPQVLQQTSHYTPGIKLDPEAVKMADTAYKSTLAATEAEANARYDAAIQQGWAYQDQTNALAKQAAIDETNLAEAKKQTDDSEAKLEQSMQDYEQHRQINPNRAYENMGTGGRILAAIAQGLGAFGSAITHSPNYAMEMIQKAVDADIRAQEHDVETLGRKVNLAQNRVAFFRQKGLDKQQASVAARATIMQDTANKLTQIASIYKAPEILAQAQQIQSGILQNRAAMLADWKAKEQAKNTTETVRGYPAGPKVEDQIRLNGLNVDVPDTDPATGKPTGRSTVYQARSQQDAEKVRDALVVRNAIRSGMQQLKGFMEGTTLHSAGKNASQIESIADDLRTQFGVLRKLGALSNADYKIASQIGDPASFFQRDSTTYQLMQSFDARLNQAVESELRGRGLIK